MTMYRKTLCVALHCLLAVLSVGCQTNPTDSELRTNVEEQCRVMEELTSVLEGIVDRESATASRGELETLRRRWEELLAEVKESQRSALDLPDILGPVLYKRIEAQTQALAAAYTHITSNPEIRDAVGDSFRLEVRGS